MPHARALLLAIGCFIVFTDVIVAIFLAVDVKMVLIVGPLAIVAISSFGVYRQARTDA